MSHPFEVGKTYRNRSGEYVVQEIVGDRMNIRYVDGRNLETSVRIQARIWENIQFEKQMAMAEERKRQAMEERRLARQRKARAKRERAKPKFAGFEESDFEEKKRGLAWSSRKELGRVLAYELSQKVAGSFDHRIVPRRSKIHVMRKDYYDTEIRENNAALFVEVSPEGASYGFRVGKPAGKAKAKLPWSLLMEALAKEEGLRQTLHSVLGAQGLQLDVFAMEMSYGLVGRITAQEEGYLWEHEDAEQQVSQSMSGEELMKRLQKIALKQRCDLYARKLVPPKDALKAGTGVASEIVEVFEALVPLYDVGVGA
jgi:hypothetical protein